MFEITRKKFTTTMEEDIIKKLKKLAVVNDIDARQNDRSWLMTI
jgi:hypothetical protein